MQEFDDDGDNADSPSLDDDDDAELDIEGTSQKTAIASLKLFSFVIFKSLVDSLFPAFSFVQLAS